MVLPVFTSAGRRVPGLGPVRRRSWSCRLHRWVGMALAVFDHASRLVNGTGQCSRVVKGWDGVYQQITQCVLQCGNADAKQHFRLFKGSQHARLRHCGQSRAKHSTHEF
jgi:hypothetical protein